VNNELGGTWLETAASNLKYDIDISRGYEENHANPQGNRHSRQDLNQVPPYHNSEGLPLNTIFPVLSEVFTAALLTV
jgi:hypothetical protein